MYLVTQGKGRINQLGYAPKTKEYVMLHNGKEVWREKGDKSLLYYFNNMRLAYGCINEEDIAKLPTKHVWEKYCEWCYNITLHELMKGN